MLHKSLLLLLFLIPVLNSFGQDTIEHVHKAAVPKYRFPLDSGGYHGKLVSDTLLYPDKSIKEIGTFAVKWDSIKSDLRVGLWSEYYANGQLKSRGNYQADWYISCCFAGRCMQYLHYKTGSWSYYYENGQLKASGTYLVKKGKIETTCRGGDVVYRAHVTKSWSYFDESGKKLKMSKKFIRLQFEEDTPY
jgi:antitoxin component YwqK of YwqJK toxin-antitoxin module